MYDTRLIKAYGWEEVSHPKMTSFIKENKRMNIYSTGTITIQWKDRRPMVVERDLADDYELEDFLIKYSV